MTLEYIRCSENLCGGCSVQRIGVIREAATDHESRADRHECRRRGGCAGPTLAAATIWLLLTDPVTVADAVSEQDVTPFVRQLVNVIFQVLRQLVRYL